MKKSNDSILFNQFFKAIIISVVLFLLIIGFFDSCMQYKKYKYTVETCVNGYYEEYWTGGRMVNSPTMTSNRKNERWICTEHKKDTVVGYKYVWKQ